MIDSRREKTKSRQKASLHFQQAVETMREKGLLNNAENKTQFQVSLQAIMRRLASQADPSLSHIDTARLEEEEGSMASPPPPVNRARAVTFRPVVAPEDDGE